MTERTYWQGIGHAASHLLNAFFAGRDETASCRIGRHRQKHGGLHWYVTPVAWFLELVDPGHLARAVENERRNAEAEVGGE